MSASVHHPGDDRLVVGVVRAAHQQGGAPVGGLAAGGRVDVAGERLEVGGTGQHRSVVAGRLGHRRPAYDRGYSRGGGRASVASSTSMPVTCSRSTMIERICASTTSADRSATRSTSRGALADPQQPAAYVGRGAVRVRDRVSRGELVGQLVDHVGQVHAQQHVGPRQRLVVVAGQRHPPHQHPGVAQRPVQRLDQLDHPADVADVPPAERRGRQHRQPLVGGVLELADQPVGGAGVGEHLQPARPTSPVLGAAGPGPQQLARSGVRRRRPAHGAGAAAPGDDGRRHQGDGAADQGVEPRVRA